MNQDVHSAPAEDEVSTVTLDSRVLACLRLHLLRKEFDSLARDIEVGKTQGELNSRLGVEHWIEEAILVRLEAEGAIIPRHLLVRRKTLP